MYLFSQGLSAIFQLLDYSKNALGGDRSRVNHNLCSLQGQYGHCVTVKVMEFTL